MSEKLLVVQRYTRGLIHESVVGCSVLDRVINYILLNLESVRQEKQVITVKLS
jgi:hypothetical protein